MSKPLPAPGALPALPDDDALNPKVAVSCLDFLLIELVPVAQRVAEQLHAREQALLDEYQKSKIFNKRASGATGAAGGNGAAVGVGSGSVRDSTTTAVSSLSGATLTTTGGPGIGSGGHGSGGMSDEIREAVFWRLDNLGYRVGQGLVER